MAITLTAETFVAGVHQSGLIDKQVLDKTLAQHERAHKQQLTAAGIADLLVECKLVTRWQAEKLLQGKFKGFLLGRYRLLNLLGRGEMSSIYLAEHVTMKRRCAIKVLPANKVKDTSYLGRFEREAQAVAALDHPNIVRAYDVDMEREAGTEIHFLVKEYVEGMDLEKLVAEKQQLAITDAVEYARQAAEGLAHAHEAGLIHRDIKPGNLLINTKGVVKLLDLGLARFFKENEEESLTIKHDEKVLGTADYLAPEQAVDSHAVDERADVYSLGCTLYFALTGSPPFTDGTLVQRLLAHQTKTPPSIHSRRKDVPASLVEIISKMMMKNRDDRYQSAADVAAALSRWLVENGGSKWRTARPEVIASVGDTHARGVQRTAPAEDVQRAVTPQTTPAASTIFDDETPTDDQPNINDFVIASDESPERVADNQIEPVEVPHHRRSHSSVPVFANSVAKAIGADRSDDALPIVKNRQSNVVTETAAWLLRDRKLFYIAGFVLAAAILAAGTGLTLQAFTQPRAKTPAVQQPADFAPGLE